MPQPASAFPRLTRGHAVCALALALLLAGLSCAGTRAAAGEPCGPAVKCNASLRCIDSKCVQIDKARDEASDVCRRTWSCKRAGLCTAGPTQCVAGSDAECRRSILCQDLGLCRARNGECVK